MSRAARWARVAAGIAGPGTSEARLRAAVSGRVVLVTGASAGIGAATAERVGAAGATVLLVARTVARLDAVRDAIAAAGGTAHVHPADLSDPAAAEALGEELVRRYRRIDVVVHNAGRSIRRSIADTADRFHDVQRTIGLNYLGPVQLLLVLLPAMRATGGGHLVNVSTAGLGTPAHNWSSYLGSKAAFDTWLRCAAPELRVHGITVSTVYCGLVRTRMSAPTAAYRRLPAMNPPEAAAVVCRAIARRPRTQQVWWARSAEVVATAFKGSFEQMLAAQLRLSPAAEVVRVLAGMGMLRPSRVTRLAQARRRYGSTLTAAAAAGPREGVALIDAGGPVSRPALRDAARHCAAGAVEALGVRPGDRVAVICGPGRGLVIATVGLGMVGADAILVAPDLPADRVDEVLRRERVDAAIHDDDHADRVPDSMPAASWSSLRAEPARLPRARPGRLVVLTSGTTGTPRSVRRRVTMRALVGPITTHLRLIALRPGEPIAVAAPSHHGYGLTYLAAGLALGLPVVLTAGLGARETLAMVSAHRAVALVALPVQLSRICDLPDPLPDVDRVRAVINGASPLSPALCRRLLERFGDRVYNLYGTTEVGWAAIATPADLRAAPGTVGRAPRGVRLRVLDPEGRPLPPGQTGEVHVAGWAPDGAALPTGDLGHLDRAGRLLLDGRMDDMIVSGGENVYPAPVAAVIAEHPAVHDVLVEPVADDEFGRRLHAWVQPRSGAAVTGGDLRAWLRDRLSRAEMPREIEVVAQLPVR